MSRLLDSYRRAGCRTKGQVLALASAFGQVALAEAHAALFEAGRENSTAMVVVPGEPPGRNVCGLIRSIAQDRSRVIVVVQRDQLAPGSYEKMLRASMPDCEKKIRVMDADGDLADMISSAERNKHYNKNHALTVVCPPDLADGFTQGVSTGTLSFDPTVISVQPMKVPSDDSGAIVKAVGAQDQAAMHRVLDPHVFSSPEGPATYRDALPSIGESNRMVGRMIREFLTDVAPSRDLAIDRLHDVLASHVDDISSLQYLGSGRNGSAYRSPDGFILKVTTDANEARSAERLVGLETEHLGRVYSIFDAAPGIWIIEQEDLERLPDDMVEQVDMALQVLENLGSIDCLNGGDIAGVVSSLAAAGPRGVRQGEMVVSILGRFGVPGMCLELRSLGLSADFHSGNIMLRRDVPVLIDLGTPGDDPGDSTIREFGTGAPGSGASGPPTMRGSNSSSWSNGRGALRLPQNNVPEDENADESDYALDWGPGRVTGASF